MLMLHTIAMKPGRKPTAYVSAEWSPRLAYAVGLLAADGCLLNDGRHIDFTSKDRAQVQTFKECLGLKVKTGVKKSGIGRRCYRAQFGDVVFYRFLQSIGLQSAKSKTIASILVPHTYFSDFLRGYFDGDGTSYSFYDSVFPESYRFYIAFTSASPSFVSWLRKMVKDVVGVEGHVYSYPDRNYFQLKYSKRGAIAVSRYMYRRRGNLFLDRKFLKIQNSLSIINQRRGGEIW